MYGGALVSNADIGLKGNTEPVMPHGNTHGGLVQLDGDWYIFHHRHTAGQEASRQGVAEKLPIRADGWFGQAEITSCGLNRGPLPAEGEYNACYCCHLTSPSIRKERYTVRDCRRDTETYLCEEPVGKDEKDFLHYIANVETGTVAGYKYFNFEKPVCLTLILRGRGAVRVSACTDAPDAAAAAAGGMTLQGGWETLTLDLRSIRGVHALYLRFETEKRIEFEQLAFA